MFSWFRAWKEGREQKKKQKYRELTELTNELTRWVCENPEQRATWVCTHAVVGVHAVTFHEDVENTKKFWHDIMNIVDEEYAK